MTGAGEKSPSCLYEVFTAKREHARQAIPEFRDIGDEDADLHSANMGTTGLPDRDE
jgi:hypothetical protein